MKLSTLLARMAAAAISVATIACTEPAVIEPDPDAAAQVGEAERLPTTLPPPNETTPRYVGLWAANAQGCAEPAWRFEPTGVGTRGEVSCTFDNVQIVESGYDIQATCQAQAPPEQHRIQLSFAESARAMMISGGPWGAPTSLVYCAPLGGN
jgi:hypothetical protein